MNVVACYKDTTVGGIIKTEQQPDNGRFSITEQKAASLSNYLNCNSFNKTSLEPDSAVKKKA